MCLKLKSNNKDEICDFLEYNAFTKGQVDFSNEDYFFYENEDEDEDETTSKKIKEIKNKLEERLKLYYPYNPYLIKRYKIISNFKTEETRKENLHYIFCLFFSLNGAKDVTRIESTLFERIVDISLKKYLHTSNSIQTSFGDTKLNIKNKINVFLDSSKEKPGDLEIMPPCAKDGGIDIVTYKSLDERGNQIVILTDATLGKHWKTKNVLSKLNHWEQYIHFKTKPLTCLAIAGIIPNERFHYASRENGLLFDRPRIVNLFLPEKNITTELINWRKEKCDL